MVAKGFDEKAFEKMLNGMEHKATDIQRVADVMEAHIAHAKRICHIWSKVKDSRDAPYAKKCFKDC